MVHSSCTITQLSQILGLATLIYAASTAHHRFYTVPLTEVQYTRCSIFGNVTILKPTSVQLPVDTNRSTLTTPSQCGLSGIRWFVTIPRSLYTADHHWYGASLRTVEHHIHSLTMQDIFCIYLVLTRIPEVGSQQLHTSDRL